MAAWGPKVDDELGDEVGRDFDGGRLKGQAEIDGADHRDPGEASGGDLCEKHVKKRVNGRNGYVGRAERECRPM